MSRERKTSGIDVGATKANLRARIRQEFAAVAFASDNPTTDLHSAMVLVAAHGPCPTPCRDCGISQALLALCEYEANAPETATGEAKQLHDLIEVSGTTLRRLNSFRSLRQGLQRWIEAFDRKHVAMAPWGPRWLHDHEALCERPRRIVNAIDVVLNELPKFRTDLPMAFGPDALRQPAGKKPRASLVTQLEDYLEYGGFSVPEIAQIVVDGGGGDDAHREDRTRKRRLRAARRQ